MNAQRLVAALLMGLALSILDVGSVARAEGPGAPAAVVTPPELLESVDAEYPPEARAARREGQVVLKLTIDVGGRVTDSEVAVAGGYGFDEAARAAALQFRFSPARRGDTPVGVRILYTYDFRLPAAPVPAPAVAPGTGVVSSSSQPGAPPAVEGEKKPIEVVVRGKSESDRLRQSAQAVQVIETEQAKRQTADLGEVMARSQGIGVQREGGLGSQTRFSLNGFTDDQIRFFLDGLPLELSGYPFGIANVPVNLVKRVEVYRGVVPIRFGADALGGAVNLVTEQERRGTHGSASYQVGSFGTHRVTLGARHIDPSSGFFAHAAGFYDYSKNNYAVDDVKVADITGAQTSVRADRFHDAYRGTGGNVEVGFVDRPWAKSLRLRAFFTDYSKDLQNDVGMKRSYGAVEYGKLSTGATLRYEHALATRAGRISFDLVGGYTYGITNFLDVSICSYNWLGQCTPDSSQRLGEIERGFPRDRLIWEHTGFGRFNAGWRVHPQHEIRASLSPTYTTRTGEERRLSAPGARDPLSAKQDLFSFVSGLEYQVDLADRRLENIVFVKDYMQLQRSEEPLAGGGFGQRDRDSHRVGVGNALRYRVHEWLYAKASYEWATRVPRPDEIFGNGVLVTANLELQPESSHNVNLGFTGDARETPAGAFRFDVNGFLRVAQQLISIQTSDRFYSYQNVNDARSVGVETSAGWTSPGEYVALDGNVTYQDFRNTSKDGRFGMFEGDRIPNRPYLFANASARFQLRNVRRPRDELALIWHTRYVHEFFPGWESAGAAEGKVPVPSQLLHALALTYLVRGDPVAMSFTGEVQNLTDTRAYDFFGVQRPGRAFFFKTTAEF